VENSGSDLKWTFKIDEGQGQARFPGNRGFYGVSLKMIALKNLGITHSVAHLITNPAVNSKTYMDMGQTRPPGVEKILRSFVVGGDDSVAVDFSDSMEYFIMDLNSTDLVNLIIVGPDGQTLVTAQGHCVMNIK